MSLVSPERTVAVGPLSLALSGTFGTLKAVQHAFGRDVVQILLSVRDMRLDEVVKLLAVASGRPDDEELIGQTILDEIGIFSPGYTALKAELTGWLDLAISPERDREKKARALDGILAGLKTSASPGGPTRNSPSASSAGRRRRSGTPPSGS